MPAPNFTNRTLYHGDNLPFLRGMNSESVQLIATDPPFNKGKDFHATPDSLAAGARFQDRWSWADDVEQTWVDQIADDWPAVHAVIEAAKISYGQDMAAFLCFMGVRLLEMRRILRKDGSMYLHCDPTASHYLKQLMDAVFGTHNFVNEIVWYYQTGGASEVDLVASMMCYSFTQWGAHGRSIATLSKSLGQKKRCDGPKIQEAHVSHLITRIKTPMTCLSFNK